MSDLEVRATRSYAENPLALPGGELEIVPPVRWVTLPLLTAEEVLARAEEARKDSG